MEKLAKNIRECRKMMGMTQKQLAFLLGVSKSTVSNYEKGVSTPSPQMMGRLVEVLDVPMSRFFLREEEIMQLFAEVTAGGLDIVTGACPNEDGGLNLYLVHGNEGECVEYQDYKQRYFRVRIGTAAAYDYVFMELCNILPDTEEIIYACLEDESAQVYKISVCDGAYVLCADGKQYIKDADQIHMIGIGRA